MRVTNAGGEGHTFTEVTAYGGGMVPLLNGVGGPAGTVPLVEAGACAASPAILGPGNTVQIKGLSPGGAHVPVLYPPLDARGSRCGVEAFGPRSGGSTRPR